ncbi:hypothetical protein [Solemya elarraichensis gill symbiont]|nr:hypothetical protein [Solemya elarraichensis gill symbiont]
MLTLFFLWRWRTSEKQSRLVATGDAPSILSPWRAASAFFQLAM